MDEISNSCQAHSATQLQNKLKTLSLDSEQLPPQKQQNSATSSKTCQNPCLQPSSCISCHTSTPTKSLQQKQQKKPQCKKCKKISAVLLVKNQPVCKQCLIKNIQYKARLTLQNKIKITSKSKLLISFSGGLSSICLVYILYNIKNKYKKNPLFDTLQCIHIQQQSKLPNSYISQFQSLTQLKLNIIPIQSIYGKQSNKTFQDINQLFHSCKNNNNSIDLLTLFRNKLIIEFAKQHQFDFVMMGNNAQSLSAEIFKYFCKGIGGSTPELSSSQPGPFQYPLRQHLLKQLQYYFHHHKLSTLSMLASNDDISHIVTTSIDSCLDQFITTLQNKYTHTAPAIIRASEKLKSNFDHVKTCKWCWIKHDRKQDICQKCMRLREVIGGQEIWKMMPSWMIL